MRGTAHIAALLLGVCALAPVGAQAATTAYAVGQGSPNNIPLTIPLYASVGSSCAVVNGNSQSAAFNDSKSLGTGGVIVDAKGHLLSSLSTSASGSAAYSNSFEVACSGTANTFSLKATPLAVSTTAPTGYANSVNYTAEVDFVTTGSNVSFSHTSDSATHSSALPSGVGLANTASDVTIQAYGFNVPLANDILVANSNYQGVITLTVSPGV